jgi:hypothetical protein
MMDIIDFSKLHQNIIGINTNKYYTIKLIECIINDDNTIDILTETNQRIKITNTDNIRSFLNAEKIQIKPHKNIILKSKSKYYVRFFVGLTVITSLVFMIARK